MKKLNHIQMFEAFSERPQLVFVALEWERANKQTQAAFLRSVGPYAMIDLEFMDTLDLKGQLEEIGSGELKNIIFIGWERARTQVKGFIKNKMPRLEYIDFAIAEPSDFVGTPSMFEPFSEKPQPLVFVALEWERANKQTQAAFLRSVGPYTMIDLEFMDLVDLNTQLEEIVKEMEDDLGRDVVPPQKKIIFIGWERAQRQVKGFIKNKLPRAEYIDFEIAEPSDF